MTIRQEKFYKCQSLGNDFILLDWLAEDQNEINALLASNDWSDFVSHLCLRNFGIGADGVLIVKKRDEKNVEGMVFNADGSWGQTSLNGLRCIANFLVKQKKYPNNFTVFMGDKVISCLCLNDEISLKVSNVIYEREKKLNIKNCEIKTFKGLVVDVGNPHFVIFSSIDPIWLADSGRIISEHKYFPNRTNVEFVWETSAKSAKCKSYGMLVYERGCGITLSCGSGAAAVAMALHKLNQVAVNEIFSIEMTGGELKTCIDEQNNVIQWASAEIVFCGSF